MGGAASVDHTPLLVDPDEEQGADDTAPEVVPDAALPEDAVARAAEVAEEVLTLDQITMAFGGVVALNDVSFTVHRGPDLRDHRAERRRQDDAVQLRDRRVPAHRRRHHPRQPVARRPQAAPDHRRPGSPARSRTSACSRT